MIFAILTLLSALSLATVAGWFSIIGVMAIYAGAPIHALIMGVVLEGGKLVTTSWLYRNWKSSSWALKLPLIIFTAALMLATSIGVFGFLSKAHLQQGVATLDNGPKIERLDQQIAREKETIADSEKVIAQLDATINSYLGKDRADRSVVIRRSQAPQRKQLREEIDAANKRIDLLSEERLKLQSEVRAMELEVGPVRYIAELIYGTENSNNKTLESAVKIFTLLIVSTLDPLAVTLLIAANHTLIRRRDEKEEKTRQALGPQEYTPSGTIPTVGNNVVEEQNSIYSESIKNIEQSRVSSIRTRDEDSRSEYEEEGGIHTSISPNSLEKHIISDEKENSTVQNTAPETTHDMAASPAPDKVLEEMGGEVPGESDPTELNIGTTKKIPAQESEEVSGLNEKEKAIVEKFYKDEYWTRSTQNNGVFQVPRASTITSAATFEDQEDLPVDNRAIPWAHQQEVLRELVGNTRHFTPQALDEEKKPQRLEKSLTTTDSSENSSSGEITSLSEEGQEMDKVVGDAPGSNEAENSETVPKQSNLTPLSWIKEFKNDNRE